MRIIMRNCTGQMMWFCIEVQKKNFSRATYHTSIIIHGQHGNWKDTG
jgi:hypothetical protein